MDPGSVVFGRYLLLEQIGAGGAGVVWKATDQLLHQTVALKRVSFAGLDNEQAQLTRDRGLREARLAAQLRSHPHVVTVYDVLSDDSDIWLVMEYLQARSLSELLRTQGRLAPVDAARIGAQVADALAAAHALGIEHRDVKPGNVLIHTDGTVKLTDFGISHLTGDPHLTHTGITGTPAYLAPEVAGSGESSPASDVFSLGSTLYAAVEGQPPFGVDDNILRLLSIIRTGIIRPPTHAGPLESLLLRLLQPIPTTRPDADTTRDLLTQLAAQLTDPTEHIPTGRAQAPKTVLGLKRWWREPARRVTVTAATLLAAATAATVVIALRPESVSPDPPPSLTSGNPRDADPCSLLDIDSLDQFGESQFAASDFLQGCQIDINTNNGEKAMLRVVLKKPDPVSEPGETPDRTYDIEIVPNNDVSYWGDEHACQRELIPHSDQPRILIYAFTYSKKLVDRCAIAQTATVTATEALERNGGIIYTPDRTSIYSHASSDACTLLDRTALGKIPALNLDGQLPGFADWSCVWGTADEDDTEVTLQLRLHDSELLHHYEKEFTRTEIAGKVAYIDDDNEWVCNVRVIHRPVGAVIEAFEVPVGSPLSTEERCDQAAELAKAVEEQLPDT